MGKDGERSTEVGHDALVSRNAILHLSLPVADIDAAEAFYVDTLGCRRGRKRSDWIDVWFFGMQLTLQCRPGEVSSVGDQGVRHFGVALSERDSFDRLVERLSGCDGVHWLTRPTAHPAGALSGKTEMRIADPSGNVIEIKFYADPADFLAGAT
jgi:extradiol dioxygenase family protein